MGLLSKRKGRSFEQLIATKLREAFPNAAVRRSIQSHRACESDVVVEPGDGQVWPGAVWWELTHGKNPNVKAKLEQAESDAQQHKPNFIPVCVWREHGERSINASLRLSWLMHLGVSGGIIGEYNQPYTIVTMSFDDFVALLKGKK